MPKLVIDVPEAMGPSAYLDAVGEVLVEAVQKLISVGHMDLGLAASFLRATATAIDDLPTSEDGIGVLRDRKVEIAESGFADGLEPKSHRKITVQQPGPTQVHREYLVRKFRLQNRFAASSECRKAEMQMKQIADLPSSSLPPANKLLVIEAAYRDIRQACLKAVEIANEVGYRDVCDLREWRQSASKEDLLNENLVVIGAEKIWHSETTVRCIQEVARSFIRNGHIDALRRLAKIEELIPGPFRKVFGAGHSRGDTALALCYLDEMESVKTTLRAAMSREGFIWASALNQDVTPVAHLRPFREDILLMLETQGFWIRVKRKNRWSYEPGPTHFTSNGASKLAASPLAAISVAGDAEPHPRG